MRAFILFALIACSTSISTKKEASISQDDGKYSSKSSAMINSGKIFGYAREKGKKAAGKVITKVSKMVTMLRLSPEQQKKSWIDLVDKQFPLKLAGFAQWRPTRTGLVFRTDDEKSTKYCQSSKHTGHNNSVVFRFQCDPAVRVSPRFAQQRYYYYWVPVTDGCPYGWQGYWDDWTWNYFAVGPKGYYGCNSLTQQAWCPDDTPNCACAGQVGFYPFTNCDDNDDDCLPYTGYVYDNYYLPYCDTCQSVSPDYSPGCPDCPYDPSQPGPGQSQPYQPDSSGYSRGTGGYNGDPNQEAQPASGGSGDSTSTTYSLQPEVNGQPASTVSFLAKKKETLEK